MDMVRKLLFVLLICCFVPLLSSCTKTEQTSSTDISESTESKKTDDAFMPFVKTVAAEYAYIEIVPGGLDAYREDGSVVEPARLSDEDAERVFELLRQIRIEKPPLNNHAWESPEGGYGAIFQVSRYISSMTDDVSTLTVIPGGKVVMISEIKFLADEEVVSELCDLYDELYCKYYPDLAEKWGIAANG